MNRGIRRHAGALAKVAFVAASTAGAIAMAALAYSLVATPWS
ncbi:hypothetical protein [Microbacterium sp.]|nr:hypothetical protein [Microbacterium sp.]